MSWLFCVHVHGPDDIYACADREEAVRLAEEMNSAIARFPHKDDPNPPVMTAVVATWPWSPESHAQNLVRGKERFR